MKSRQSALVIVDIQNDFLPGGALAVEEGDQVIPVINKIQSKFELVVATQDWHPANHGSFASQHPGRKPGEVVDLDGLAQVLWPDHCVQHSKGAEFDPRFDRTRVARVFQKGVEPEIDSYSGLFDNGHRRGTGLAEYLKETAVTDVFICGLATDYCVKFTALDARQLGYTTMVIVDACRGVNLKDGDVDAAIEALRAAGTKIVTSAQLP